MRDMQAGAIASATERWLAYATRLQALAQDGLMYAQNP